MQKFKLHFRPLQPNTVNEKPNGPRCVYKNTYKVKLPTGCDNSIPLTYNHNLESPKIMEL